MLPSLVTSIYIYIYVCVCPSPSDSPFYIGIYMVSLTFPARWQTKIQESAEPLSLFHQTLEGDPLITSRNPLELSSPLVGAGAAGGDLVGVPAAVEALQAHDEPAGGVDADAAAVHHLALHEHDALVGGEVDVVRDGGVRLGELAPQLVFGQLGEEHRGGARGGAERPLQEVDLGPALRVRHGEHELRVLPRRCLHGRVRRRRHHGAQRPRRRRVPQPPDGCQLRHREVARLREGENRREGLDAGGGRGGGGDAGLCWLRRWWW